MANNIQKLLGTNTKIDTLAFIGGMLGGALAAINAMMIYARVSGQDYNNKLAEKEQIEGRFQFASKKLESRNSVTLIFAFYQFYYLAKQINIPLFKKNIFDVLCVYLQHINSNIETHDGLGNPTRQYQTLLNVLFMPQDNSSFGLRVRSRLSKACPSFYSGGSYLFPFAKFNANFKNVDFTNMNLSNAYFAHGKFEKVTFTGADLEGANFKYAEFIDTDLSKAKAKGADFYRATINGRPILLKDLPPSYRKEYKEEHEANLIFWKTMIVLAFFFGLGFMSLGVSCWGKVFGGIMGIMISMPLGAMLGTFLCDNWASCQRILCTIMNLIKTMTIIKVCWQFCSRKLKRLWKCPLRLFLVVAICVSVLGFLLFCYWLEIKELFELFWNWCSLLL